MLSLTTPTPAVVIKRSIARWCVGIAMVGLPIIAGTQAARQYNPRREWTTVAVPDPPRPHPDSTASTAPATALKTKF